MSTGKTPRCGFLHKVVPMLRVELVANWERALVPVGVDHHEFWCLNCEEVVIDGRETERNPEPAAGQEAGAQAEGRPTHRDEHHPAHEKTA